MKFNSQIWVEDVCLTDRWPDAVCLPPPGYSGSDLLTNPAFPVNGGDLSTACEREEAGRRVQITRINSNPHEVSAADASNFPWFAAVRGIHSYTSEQRRQWWESGIVGILSDQPLPEWTGWQCVVPDVRRAYAEICSLLASAAARRLPVVGVTGTNGKTTTAWLIRWICSQVSQPCGMLGTIEYDDGRAVEPANLTTPDPRTLWKWLDRMAENHCAAAVMELSSHALQQRRAAGLQLAAGVVTNITQDHLDYHGSYDDYWHSKFQLFSMLSSNAAAIVNRDDPGAARCLARLGSQQRRIVFSSESRADIWAGDLRLTAEGSCFRVATPQGDGDCRLPIAGRHNVSNALAAIAVSLELGMTLQTILDALSKFPGVPGRLQRIQVGQPFSVFVDFAHTEDGLRQCLETVREFSAGRVICVFGAGGNRDRSKRPRMGAVAGKLADIVILTSDNPRTEAPQAILDEIAAGMRTLPELRSGAHYCEQSLDRRTAIARAIGIAEPGDCVVVAGKGHEQFQIVGGESQPFNDRQVVTECLLARCPSPTATWRISA